MIRGGGGGLGRTYMEPTVRGVLRKKQVRLIRENHGVVESIARGAKAAIHECKYQFRNRRWNCPTKSIWRGKSVFGKIVERGESQTILFQKSTDS